MNVLLIFFGGGCYCFCWFCCFFDITVILICHLLFFVVYCCCVLGNCFTSKMVISDIMRNPSMNPSSRPFYCNATARFFFNRAWKLWKAKNAKQKQMVTVRNNVTQLLKNSVEFVGIKATNHVRYFT